MPAGRHPALPGISLMESGIRPILSLAFKRRAPLARDIAIREHLLLTGSTTPSTGCKRTTAYSGIIAVVVAIGTSFFISSTAWVLLTLAMGVVCLSMLLY
ncbi:MAG: hypothetical protein WBY88_12770, partial [Desulfosarcina sp.]